MLAGAAYAEDVCRVLVLSGGGSNGAWEAGVLYGMLNGGNPADYEWDVVTGVSAGSINTSAIAGWKKGEESEMVSWLSDLWLNLHTDDVWQDWTLGKTAGLTYKQGAVNNEYLLAFLRNVLSKFTEYGRRVTLGSVNVNSGVYTEFNQDNLLFSELADAAVSSASIPLVFPPHVWDKGVFMDGGTVYNIDPEGAVHTCLDGIVDDESKIIMDIYICDAPDAEEEIEKTGNGWQNYFRGRGIGKYYGNTSSVAYFQKGHPSVTLRHVVLQKANAMSGLGMLNFEGD